MKIVQAYEVSRASFLLGRFLSKEEAEVLRDKENTDYPSNLLYYTAKVTPCFLLEVEQNGITLHFMLQPVHVT